MPIMPKSTLALMGNTEKQSRKVTQCGNNREMCKVLWEPKVITSQNKRNLRKILRYKHDLTK